jgi:hypothetical protein
MRNTLATTLFVIYAGSAFAQSAPVFAPNGQYLGTAVKNGNTTVFVDKNGKYGGAVVQNHNGMAVFDKNGQHTIRPPQWGSRPPHGYGHNAGGYAPRPPHPHQVYGNYPSHHYNGYAYRPPHHSPGHGNRPPYGYHNGFGGPY